MKLAVIFGLPAVLVTALAAESAMRRSPGPARTLSALSLLFVLALSIVLGLVFQLAAKIWSTMSA
jgi:hypothetical protein